MFDQVLVAVALQVQYQRAKPNLNSTEYGTRYHRDRWFFAKYGPSWELWCEAMFSDGSWFSN